MTIGGKVEEQNFCHGFPFFLGRLACTRIDH
jgi:hypothetical protein